MVATEPLSNEKKTKQQTRALEGAGVLNIKDIVEILPHRYPFLLVDKIIKMDLEEDCIVGQKNVTANESFFQGHFPGAPIMPGVLILEALAQTGSILVNKKGFEGKIAVLLSIKNAKFRNPVKPGDILLLETKGIHFSGKGGRVQAIATVDGKLVVQAEIGFALVDKKTI
jgi:3-hydroxyacyl-[acyl-carrier-protein] dehydratase